MTSGPAREQELQRCIAEHLREAGVDPGYQRFIRDHLERDDDGWRWCCGSTCDPCVTRLAQVVDRVRAALRQVKR